jgi:TPP-dependent indolepyruvate ferredoxin oxidoreductase alpha subunit
MSQILGSQTVVSTGGEGSFFHGGLLSLQSAVQNGISLLHVVFDNRAVAMTGHQPSPTTEGSVNWRKLLEAIGVDWVAEASAFEPMEVAAQVRKAILKKGVRVVWITGNCALQPDEEMLRRRRVRTLEIENKNCGSCALCYQDLGCPAIQQISLGKRDLFIDMDRCVRCGECLNVCPNEAIKITETES